MWNRWICIGFEVCSKLGIPLSLLIYHFLKISSYLCIPGDCLLLWEVDLKTDNVWKLLMHVKPKQSPNSFTCRHIARIQIELDLIQATPKLHCCAIMTLVHILVDVLDCLDREKTLHVDVTAKNPKPEAWIRNHSMIVNLMISNLVLFSCVSSPEVGIRVLIYCSLISERLGETL